MKIVHAELAADPDFRARFSTEVAAARKVSGLFTALVVDADVDAPVPWLATAYVAGPSLSEAVRSRGPLTAASLLALAAGLAKSLTAIHAAGVVHGDLKPSNVLLAPDGPRVIDFGISQAAEAAPLARAGLVVGTPSFMSPEQAAGEGVGSLSDVFSLGAVLAYAATGRKPFGAGQPAAVLERVVREAADLEGRSRRGTAADRTMPGQGPGAAAHRRRDAGRGDRRAVRHGVAGRAARARPTRTCRPGRGPARPAAAAAAADRRVRRRGRPRRVRRGRIRPDAAPAGRPPGRVPDRGRDGRQASRAGAEACPPAPPPRITGSYTYQAGAMVYFVISYADPGHNAAGFGFVGVEGSDWARQHYSFSSPAEGIVEANSIAYPLNQGCGTGFEYTSTVKAWIYDKAGGRSKPVIIHLACTT